MSDPNKLLRRNFTVALIAHGAMVGGLFVGERWLPDFPKPVLTPVQLVVPADILGELPQGPGHGRGDYAPPKESAGPTHGGGVPEAVPPPRNETVAPTAKPSPPKADEIAIPKPTKKVATKAPTTKATSTTTNAKPKKPEQSRNTAPANAVASAKPGLSAEQSRAGFLSALNKAGSGSAGGTPYGDNRPAGGGTGKGRIGSPDGAADGVAGGIGQGSPNWRYYMHVHDRMYEAWDQPGSVNDRKLMAIVLVKVARDGSIVGVTLKRSSGNKAMDNSALAAARKVRMLEPPPEALVKGSAAEISVDFQMEG